jgi:hypothetical protein
MEKFFGVFGWVLVCVLGFILASVVVLGSI